MLESKVIDTKDYSNIPLSNFCVLCVSSLPRHKVTYRIKIFQEGEEREILQ